MAFILASCDIYVEVKVIGHVGFSALSGDNILTAVNVARACGMVLSHERVIFVHASPRTANSMALLQFHEGDGAVASVNTRESMDALSQVLILSDYNFFKIVHKF